MLTNLISFCVMVTGYVEGGRAADVIKALDAVSHDILMNKLKKYRLDESTLSWIRNCLDHHAQ